MKDYIEFRVYLKDGVNRVEVEMLADLLQDKHTVSTRVQGMTNDDRLFAANVILAYLQMGQCPMGYDREDLQGFCYRLLEERAHAARLIHPEG